MEVFAIATQMSGGSRGSPGRFGIGEWYGELFANLDMSQRQRFANMQFTAKRDREPQLCPFQSHPGHLVHCNKEGGVCTLRMYEQDPRSTRVRVSERESGRLRTVCPNRFEEERSIYKWVGTTILETQEPRIVPEVGFLERPKDDQAQTRRSARDDVGRIDKILVAPGNGPLRWCALEVQAVYFSGDSMKREWPNIRDHVGAGLPMPVGRRRPDYRSSGPKRLMPQLQIKVPSLRRWGKKMAVVIDLDFWQAMGRMEVVRDVSNCDIAWFVVAYNETNDRAKLVLHDVYLTTLERSIEGLTAGLPVSLEVFEQRIRAKLGTV